MKIIYYPLNPAVEDARLFVDTAFNVVNWENFREEIRGLDFCGMLSPALAQDVLTFLNGTLRRLFWEIRLSPVEYLKARRVLEAVCDVVDTIIAALGPDSLEEMLHSFIYSVDPPALVLREKEPGLVEQVDCWPLGSLNHLPPSL